MINLASSNSANAFPVRPAGYPGNLQPYGLAVTNSGIVYYGSFDNQADPGGGFHQLDTNTGKITDYYGSSLENGEAYMRVLMSPDAAYVYGSGSGCPSILSTSTNSIVNGTTACNAGDSNEDMAISIKGSILLTSDLLTNPTLNVDLILVVPLVGPLVVPLLVAS